MFETAWIWIIVAIVAVGVATLVGYLVYRIVWHRRFTTIFGFTPERVWQFRLVQQPEVDRKLARIAREFDRGAKEETALLEKYYNREEASKRSSSKEDLVELKRLRKRVEFAKTAFWRTHKAAKIAGFWVAAKYSDYLK